MHHANGVVWEAVSPPFSSASASARRTRIAHGSCALLGSRVSVSAAPSASRAFPRAYSARPWPTRCTTTVVAVPVPSRASSSSSSKGHSIRANVGVDFKGVEGGD